ncbi:uncharacterized protein LOC128237132 isoform X2 [Mya arenaria]|uniref:uncharacterized protein LOC128237132 isoform X2 n=1 Tax=Mya arenaria TaxID=6604 RepID=UPI0022E83BE5|nr:uncharacterized protein LOC128237132 isoform X2 [Mya arenaria]
MGQTYSIQHCETVVVGTHSKNMGEDQIRDKKSTFSKFKKKIKRNKKRRNTDGYKYRDHRSENSESSEDGYNSTFRVRNSSIEETHPHRNEYLLSGPCTGNQKNCHNSPKQNRNYLALPYEPHMVYSIPVQATQDSGMEGSELAISSSIFDQFVKIHVSESVSPSPYYLNRVGSKVSSDKDDRRLNSHSDEIHDVHCQGQLNDLSSKSKMDTTSLNWDSDSNDEETRLSGKKTSKTKAGEMPCHSLQEDSMNSYTGDITIIADDYYPLNDSKIGDSSLDLGNEKMHNMSDVEESKENNNVMSTLKLAELTVHNSEETNCKPIVGVPGCRKTRCLSSEVSSGYPAATNAKDSLSVSCELSENEIFNNFIEDYVHSNNVSSSSGEDDEEFEQLERKWVPKMSLFDTDLSSYSDNHEDVCENKEEKTNQSNEIKSSHSLVSCMDKTKSMQISGLLKGKSCTDISNSFEENCNLKQENKLSHSSDSSCFISNNSDSCPQKENSPVIDDNATNQINNCLHSNVIIDLVDKMKPEKKVELNCNSKSIPENKDNVFQICTLVKRNAEEEKSNEMNVIQINQKSSTRIPTKSSEDSRRQLKKYCSNVSDLNSKSVSENESIKVVMTQESAEAQDIFEDSCKTCNKPVTVETKELTSEHSIEDSGLSNANGGKNMSVFDDKITQLKVMAHSILEKSICEMKIEAKSESNNNPGNKYLLLDLCPLSGHVSDVRDVVNKITSTNARVGNSVGRKRFPSESLEDSGFISRIPLESSEDSGVISGISSESSEVSGESVSENESIKVVMTQESAEAQDIFEDSCKTCNKSVETKELTSEHSIEDNGLSNDNGRNLSVYSDKTSSQNLMAVSSHDKSIYEKKVKAKSESKSSSENKDVLLKFCPLSDKSPLDVTRISKTASTNAEVETPVSRRGRRVSSENLNDSYDISGIPSDSSEVSGKSVSENESITVVMTQENAEAQDIFEDSCKTCNKPVTVETKELTSEHSIEDSGLSNGNGGNLSVCNEKITKLKLMSVPSDKSILQKVEAKFESNSSPENIEGLLNFCLLSGQVPQFGTGVNQTSSTNAEVESPVGRARAPLENLEDSGESVSECFDQQSKLIATKVFKKSDGCFTKCTVNKQAQGHLAQYSECIESVNSGQCIDTDHGSSKQSLDSKDVPLEVNALADAFQFISNYSNLPRFSFLLPSIDEHTDTSHEDGNEEKPSITNTDNESLNIDYAFNQSSVNKHSEKEDNQRDTLSIVKRKRYKCSSFHKKKMERSTHASQYYSSSESEMDVNYTYVPSCIKQFCKSCGNNLMIRNRKCDNHRPERNPYPESLYKYTLKQEHNGSTGYKLDEVNNCDSGLPSSMEHSLWSSWKSKLNELCRQELDKIALKDIARRFYVNHFTSYIVLGLRTYFDRVNTGIPLSEGEQHQFEWLRFISFNHYQGNGNGIVLARNGFYHHPEDGPNSTRCFACGFRYNEWEMFDNVDEIHRQQSPNCPLLHGNIGEGTRRNISIVSDDVPRRRPAQQQTAVTTEPTGRNVQDSEPVRSTSSSSSSAAAAATSGASSVSSVAATSTASSAGSFIHNHLPSQSRNPIATSLTRASELGNFGRRVPSTTQPVTVASSAKPQSLFSAPSSPASTVASPASAVGGIATSLASAHINSAEGAQHNGFTSMQPTSDPKNTDRMYHFNPTTQIRGMGMVDEPYNEISVPPPQQGISVSGVNRPSSIFGNEPVGAGAFTAGQPQSMPVSGQTLVSELRSSSVPLVEGFSGSPGLAPHQEARPPPPSTQQALSYQQRAQGLGGGSGPGGAPPDRARGTGLPGLDPDLTAGIHIVSPRHPDYNTLTSRINSFSGWPSHLDQNPRMMGEAGFFYVGVADFCRCYACGGGLRNWQPGDDPVLEHARWFPQCEYIIKLKGQAFVTEIQRHVSNLSASNSTPAETPRLSENNSQDPLDCETGRQLMSMGFPQARTRRAIRALRRTHGRDPTPDEVLDWMLEDHTDSEPEDSESVTPAAILQPTSSIPHSSTTTTTTTSNLTTAPTGSINVSVTSSTSYFSRGASQENTKREATPPTVTNQREISPSGGKIREANTGEGKDSRMEDDVRVGNSDKQEPKNGGGKKKKKKKGKGGKSNQEVEPGFTEGASGGPEEEENNDNGTQIRQENEKLREMQTCKICMERQVNTTLLPCGHLVSCDRCASRLAKCPICRTKIKGSVKTFMT